MPTDGVQRLLFEAAWANERLVNQLRGAVCLFILVTDGASHVHRLGYLPASIYLIAAWAVFIGAMAYVLRRTYPRAL